MWLIPERVRMESRTATLGEALLIRYRSVLQVGEKFEVGPVLLMSELTPFPG